MSQKEQETVVIGIDLGTTNSCVAVMENGTPVVIPNAEGGRTTPSIVGYKDGSRVVGEQAKRQRVTNPKSTLFSTKRFIGREYSEVGDELKTVPYDVKKYGGGMRFVVEGKELTPEDVGAHVLIKMKETAEAYLGKKVASAIITVPAYFNDAQRQSTKDAGKLAGLEVKRVIQEPTAAALAYGIGKEKNCKLAVFDLGGGTFDISILDVADSVFEVLATHGDTHLGGDDFDSVIIRHVIAEFKKEHGIDLTKDSMALQRVKDAAEKAKIELSGSLSVEINQPFISMDSSGPKHLIMTLTRSKFEQLAAPLLERIVVPCEQALKDAGVSEVDEVILVGGMTRMPAVQQLVERIFKKAPSKGVNPDEAVAIGAAIQGGVLSGNVKQDVLLLDVCPLSLGIETMGGVFTRIVDRNTTIPSQKKQVFSTAADNQPAVTIRVLQGEREMAADNKEIGKFDLTNIPPAPRGTPQIEVTFDIDADGILHVSAKDLSTGKEQKVRCEKAGGLPQEEIEAKLREAEQFEEEDRKRKQAAEEHNEAENTLFQAEKLLKDYGDKVSEDAKKDVEVKIEALRQALSGGDQGKIRPAKEALNDSMQKASQTMQNQASGQQGDASGSKDGENKANQGQEEKVQDADVEIVDES